MGHGGMISEVKLKRSRGKSASIVNERGIPEDHRQPTGPGALHVAMSQVGSSGGQNVKNETCPGAINRIWENIKKTAAP